MFNVSYKDKWIGIRASIMSYLKKQLDCHRESDSRDSRNSEVNLYYTRITLPAASTGSE